MEDALSTNPKGAVYTRVSTQAQVEPAWPKVLGYTRVSTKAQADLGFSLVVQEERIRSFCRLQKLELVGLVSDGGRSGESLRRKGITEVFLRLDVGDASGLVVAKLDRLTRSVRDWSGLVDTRFGPSGENILYSCSETIDLSTPGGRFVALIFVGLAEQELDKGVERSGEIMDSKRAAGHQLGNVPFGSMVAEDGLTLVEHPTEASAIATIRELRSSGLAIRAIALELDRQGVPTRNGMPWSHSTVAKILDRLESKTFTGEEHGEQSTDGLESPTAGVDTA